MGCGGSKDASEPVVVANGAAGGMGSAEPAQVQVEVSDKKAGGGMGSAGPARRVGVSAETGDEGTAKEVRKRSITAGPPKTPEPSPFIRM